MNVSSATALDIQKPAFLARPFYSLTVLEKKDLPDIMFLMHDVMEELTQAGKASYVVPKPPEVYEKYLCPSRKKGFVLALKDKYESLVGSIVLDFIPADEQEKTGLTSCCGVRPLLLHLQRQNSPYCVIGNALIAKEHRGQKLLPLMLKTGIQITHSEHGIGLFAAEIAIDNIASKKGFERCGFDTVCHGVDETDGTPLVFVHKSVNGFAGLKL